VEEAAERVRSQECVVDALGHMGIVIPAAIGEPDMECRRVGGIVDLEDRVGFDVDHHCAAVAGMLMPMIRFGLILSYAKAQKVLEHTRNKWQWIYGRYSAQTV